MRKISLFLLLSLLGAAAANAQNIKTNLAWPLAVYYEHSLSDKLSLQGGLCYELFANVALSSPDPGFTRSTALCYSIPIEVRYYFYGADRPMNGLYAGPFFKYISYNTKDNLTGGGTGFTQVDKDSWNRAVIGATLGYQYMLENGLNFGVFSGLGYAVYDREKITETIKTPGAPDQVITSDGNAENLFGHLGTRLGITIGYRFGSK